MSRKIRNSTYTSKLAHMQFNLDVLIKQIKLISMQCELKDLKKQIKRESSKNAFINAFKDIFFLLLFIVLFWFTYFLWWKFSLHQYFVSHLFVTLTLLYEVWIFRVYIKRFFLIYIWLKCTIQTGMYKETTYIHVLSLFSYCVVLF